MFTAKCLTWSSRCAAALRDTCPGPRSSASIGSRPIGSGSATTRPAITSRRPTQCLSSPKARTAPTSFGRAAGGSSRGGRRRCRSRRCFNARIETVETSNAFKDAFRSTRCLIPADGYYEWTKSPADGGKDPWHIFLRDHEPFSFAGLWAHNKALDITSCTIITGPAEQPVSQLHDRQPIMLDPAVYDAWLDPQTPAENVKGLLGQRINGECRFARVSRDVNAAAINKQPNDRASMIEPVNSL